MFDTEAMKHFRETHDCRDVDCAGVKPLFIFRISERINKEWLEREGDFYADTPLEALEQAHDDDQEGVEDLLQAKCVGVCNYFYDGGEAHVILDFDLLQRFHNGLFFQSINPPLDVFYNRVIERRKEMQEENIL